MTLAEYYKHFGIVLGALTAALTGLPLITLISLPGELEHYLFPPLGDFENVARVLTIVFAAAATFLVYFTSELGFCSSKRGRPKALLLIFAFAFLCVVVYGILTSAFVIRIPIPAGKSDWFASVGFERTPFAQQNFSQLSAWEMLRKRGLEEEQIWNLWSMSSILVVRFGLWISYLLGLVSFVSITSFAVLFDKIGLAPNP